VIGVIMSYNEAYDNNFPLKYIFKVESIAIL